MKKIPALFLLVGILSSFLTTPAIAQSEPPQLITLHPMNSETRAALENWLAGSAPVDAPFYCVTYLKQDGYDFLVSLAALNISSPDEDWHIAEDGEDSKVLWVGSVRVDAGGSVEPLSHESHAGKPGLLMLAQSTLLQTDTGAITFPFEGGTFGVFGPRGVHGNGILYPLDVAVDFVGGDDMGGQSMPDDAYASWHGYVDAICDDGTSVWLRMQAHEYFNGEIRLTYGNLIANDNLVLDHEFQQGDLLGKIKRGTFDDTCGDAEQKSNHYTLHFAWSSIPGGFARKIDGCTLNFYNPLSTDWHKWTCGTEIVGLGGKLWSHSPTSNPGTPGAPGGPGTGTDDLPYAENHEKSFWDYVLIGFVSIFDRGALKLLPSHNSPTALILGLMNMVRVFFRLVWTLTKFNLNLGPVMALIFLVLAARLMMGVVWLVFAVLRTIKAIPGA